MRVFLRITIFCSVSILGLAFSSQPTLGNLFAAETASAQGTFRQADYDVCFRKCTNEEKKPFSVCDRTCRERQGDSSTPVCKTCHTSKNWTCIGCLQKAEKEQNNTVPYVIDETTGKRNPPYDFSGCITSSSCDAATINEELSLQEKLELSRIYKGTGIFEGCSVNDPGKNDIICVVNNATDKVVLPVFGALVVVMVMLAGLIYMTSMGAAKGQLALAKKALTAVFIGLIMVLLSKWIVSYIDALI